MSRGKQPYSEFATVAEVAEQIKAGYTLKCPQDCRPEVHELAMVPCWRKEASDRCGFSDVCGALVGLGAAPGPEAETAENSTIVFTATERVADETVRSAHRLERTRRTSPPPQACIEDSEPIRFSSLAVYNRGGIRGVLDTSNEADTSDGTAVATQYDGLDARQSPPELDERPADPVLFEQPYIHFSDITHL
jgi:hypothetical protein